MPTFNEESLSPLLPGVPAPSETYYRMIEINYLGAIDEIGPSMTFGGRYNPRGEFGVLYLSVSPDCAFLEKLKQYFGNKEAIPDQSIAIFRVNVRKCLNLLDSHVLEHLKLTRAMLIDPTDYGLTQTLSRAARAAGFEALLAPAATEEKCQTLVVYKDKLLPPSFCICDTKSIRAY